MQNPLKTGGARGGGVEEDTIDLAKLAAQPRDASSPESFSLTGFKQRGSAQFSFGMEGSPAAPRRQSAAAAVRAPPPPPPPSPQAASRTSYALGTAAVLQRGVAYGGPQSWA